MLKIHVIILLLLVVKGCAIWPPAYRIDLTQEETFNIFEVFGNEEGDGSVDKDDELIKETDVHFFNLEQDSDKYYRIHKLALRRNQESAKEDNNGYNRNLVRRVKETNFDLEESVPYIGGFVNKNGSYKEIVSRYENSKYMNNN